MKQNIVGLILAGSILGGCASPDFNYRADYVEVSKPPLNSVSTAYVGDELLSQGKFYDYDALIVNNQTSISGYDVPVGHYLKLGEGDSTATYSPIAKSGGAVTVKSFFYDPPGTLMTKKQSANELCVVSIYSALTCDTADFVEKRIMVFDDDSFQQTLIYSGKVGQKINIGYRERSSSQARPAFNNDVEYDLSESNVIGYKGAKLEIIEATNEYIRYRVISNFNRAVM